MELFDGKYRQEELIGRGAFSEVWRVTYVQTGVTLALKICAPAIGGEDGIEMMKHEFSLMVNINQRNLLHPLFFDICDNKPYLVLPYCKNGNINKRIGQFTEREAWKLLRDTANALDYLHAQQPPIIHQDIKPANILIGDDGSFMLTDFGISTKAKSTRSHLSKEDMALSSAGTMAYMPPEKFSSNNLPVMASDIWSLGATVYEMITGYLPFGNDGGLMQKKGADIPELQGAYSQELKDTLKKCLEQETWQRPRAAELAAIASSALSRQATVIESHTEPKTTSATLTDSMGDTEPIIPDPVIPEPVVTEPVITEPFTPEPVVTEPVFPEPVPASPRSHSHMVVIVAVCLLAIALLAGGWLLFRESGEEVAQPQPPAVVEDSVSADTPDTPSAPVVEPVSEPESAPQPEVTPQPQAEEVHQSEPVKAEVTSPPEKSTEQTRHEASKGGKGRDLGYATWTGDVEDGRPSGIGSMVFARTHTIQCNNGRQITVHAGDRLEDADFYEGRLQQGKWVKSDGGEETIWP